MQNNKNGGNNNTFNNYVVKFLGENNQNAWIAISAAVIAALIGQFAPKFFAWIEDEKTEKIENISQCETTRISIREALFQVNRELPHAKDEFKEAKLTWVKERCSEYLELDCSQISRSAGEINKNLMRAKELLKYE